MTRAATRRAPRDIVPGIHLLQPPHSTHDNTLNFTPGPLFSHVFTRRYFFKLNCIMSRAAKLAELRALRAAGKTRLSTYEVAEEEQLYDEVDEEGYKKVVRSRLDQDDFIVDDNGEGYADDGREEWDGDHPGYHYAGSESDEEEERPAKGKAGMTLTNHACT